MFSNKYLKENKKVNNIHYHLLGTGFMLWFAWQVSTLLGIILGSFIPKELGLNFAIPLTFLALIINDLKKPTYLLIALVSGVVSIITFNLPLKAYILISAASGI
ncbi:MAG: branched-chain amino acid ABC transporter permease, partial [Candidatus Fonsibacter sp.]